MHWFILTSGAMAATECVGATVDNAQLVERMDQAEFAFSALDIDAFQGAMDGAVFSLPCLADPVSAEDAAQFHRLQGLRQFVAGEEKGAKSSFQAAKSTQPLYVFPSALVPPGHVIQDLYEQAAPSNQLVPAPTPQSGTLWIDGRPALAWDPELPMLIQVLDGDTVQSTTYMLPGDTLPFLQAAPASLPVASVLVPLPISGLPKQDAPSLGEGLSRIHRPRFFLGLGLGAAAIGGWAMASQAAATYQQPNASWGEPELRRQERLTNGLTVGAGIFGLASVGMVGSAVMVMRW